MIAKFSGLPLHLHVCVMCTNVFPTEYAAGVFVTGAWTALQVVLVVHHRRPLVVDMGVICVLQWLTTDVTLHLLAASAAGSWMVQSYPRYLQAYRLCLGSPVAGHRSSYLAIALLLLPLLLQFTVEEE